MAFYWFESTPTVMSDERGTVYVNCPDRLLPSDAASRVWVDRCKASAVPVSVPHKVVAQKDGTVKAVVLTVREFDERVAADEAAAEKVVAEVVAAKMV